MAPTGSPRRRVILSVVGEQGAGKTTIGQKLARYLETDHIETSGVVRALTEKEYDKKDLASTKERTKEDPNWLGEAIYERIVESLEKDLTSVVVTGVREVEVHEYLRRRNLDVLGIDVVADPDIRCFRLIELGKIKDEKDFIEQELRERAMGLNEVMAKSSFQVSTSPETDADQIVRSLVAAIVNTRKKKVR